MVLQNIGLGVRWYFRDPWNRFDFSLVVLSISTVTLDVLNREYYCGDEEIEPSVNFPGLSVLRVSKRPTLHCRSVRFHGYWCWETELDRHLRC